MTYARARLWLGISGVGLFVVLSAIALVANVPRRLAPASDAPLTDHLVALVAFVGLFVLISLPLDRLGGQLLPRRFGLRAVGLGTWLRGATVHGLSMIAGLSALLLVGRPLGDPAAVGTFAGISIVALFAAPRLARGIAHMPRVVDAERPAVDEQLRAWGFDPSAVVVWDHDDEGFTGGVEGWGRRARAIVPVRWIRSFTPDVAAALIARRLVAARGSARTIGWAAAWAFNVVGFALALTLPGAGTASSAGLVTAALGFTLWSFAGLLTLPSLSRAATRSQDRAALAAGVPETPLRRALSTLAAEPEAETRRPRWIERIFHPVPATRARAAALDGNSRRSGAWHVARHALGTSWLGGSLLSRAVHCNCGRPELWSLLPAD